MIGEIFILFLCSMTEQQLPEREGVNNVVTPSLHKKISSGAIIAAFTSNPYPQWHAYTTLWEKYGADPRYTHFFATLRKV